MTEINTVNRMADVFSILPSLKGREFTIEDVRQRIGCPNLANSTMKRLVKQGYLTKVWESPGKATIYTVRGI